MAEKLGATAKSLFVGGVAGGVTVYAYDKFIAAPVRQAIGNFAGNWTDAAGAFGVGLALEYFSRNSSQKMRDLAGDAAVVLFGAKLAQALETNLPNIGGAPAMASGAGYGSLSPQPLAVQVSG